MNIGLRRLTGWIGGRAHPYENMPLILVAGVGRSGTTALRNSLSQHPAIHSTGTENNMIYDVLGTARHNCTFPSRRATMQVEPWMYDRQFRLLLLNLLWPRPRMWRSRPRALLAFSDLSPDRADYLRRVFPQVHVVLIVRNGIEVVASRMAHPNFNHEPFESHCRVWAATREMAEWGRGGQGFVLVRQEQLLDADHVDDVIRGVFERVGLPHHPACSEMLKGKRFHPTAYAAEKADAAADLARRSERWHLWSDAQRAMFEAICGETMQYFGYPIPWKA